MRFPSTTNETNCIFFLFMYYLPYFTGRRPGLLNSRNAGYRLLLCAGTFSSSSKSSVPRLRIKYPDVLLSTLPRDFRSHLSACHTRSFQRRDGDERFFRFHSQRSADNRRSFRSFIPGNLIRFGSHHDARQPVILQIFIHLNVCLLGWWRISTS